VSAGEALVWREYDRLGEREAELNKELLEVKRQRAELWSVGHALGALAINATVEGDTIRVSTEGKVVAIE
jgi:urease accessory protein UreE